MGLCASSDALTASQLESRLRAAKAARALNLRGCGLREIPAEALDLGSTLKTLDISSNKDIDLSGLSSFTRLKKLIVSGCGLTALPECASFAATLEHLDASGNSITSLSGIRLPAVKVLVLAGNELMGSLSELGGCANLTELELSGNSTLALPESVGALGKLQELRMTHCAVESLAGPTWERCKALRTVEVSHNALPITKAAIPSSLLADTPLSKLALAGNPGASQAAMMALPGFDAFAARRKARLDKLIAGGFSNDHDILSS